MKFIFLLLFSVLALQTNAQSSIQPIDATIKFDKAPRPCIQVNLDPEPKTLKHAWKDYLKDNYKFKLKGIGFLRNKNLLSAEKITVPQISSNAMDFYTRIVEDQNGSEMKLFVRHGYDIYVSKEEFPAEYQALQEILTSFIKYYLPKYYEGEINDTEKRVNELTGQRDDLKNDIKKKSSSIEKLRKQIDNREKELKSKQEQIETTEQKLTTRQEKLKRIRIQIQNL